MSYPTENWGQIKLVESKKEADGKILQLVSTPKGREGASFVPKPIISIPISSVASINSSTKNDLSLTLRPLASSSSNGIQLQAVRFAIPNICVGYEQTEEAGKEVVREAQEELKSYQQKFLQTHGGSEEANLLALATLATAGTKADEKVIAVFEDVSFSYPSGIFKMLISNYNVVLEPKRGNKTPVSFPLSDIQQLYMCEIPQTDGSQYIVALLKAPVKVGNSTHAHLVISCPADFTLDEEHPWKCELQSQEEINKALRLEPGAECHLKPTLHGPVSTILVLTLKTIAKVRAFDGVNADYTRLTGHESSVRASYRSKEGLLYFVRDGLLFLPNPATKFSFESITEATIDENESGMATFQMSILTGRTKHSLYGIEKKELTAIATFMKENVKQFHHYGTGADDDDDDDDDDEDDEEDDDEESDDDLDEEEEDEDSDDEDEDDDEDDDEGSRKRKRTEKKEKKEKKEKTEKKEKKEKKDKKHKKHKDKEHKHKHKHKKHKSEKAPQE